MSEMTVRGKKDKYKHRKIVRLFDTEKTELR